MEKYVATEVKEKYNGREYYYPIGAKAENIITNDDMQFISKKELNDLKAKPGPTSPVNSNVVTFTQTSTRIDISSGDTLSVLFGKIKKWFADLRTAAFREVTDSVKTGADTDVTTKKALKEVNDNLGGLRFYEDSNGKWVVGADTVPKKLGDVREERSANASILLNYQYLTTRNSGLVFGKDDSKNMNVTYQNYDNEYEAIFQVDGSNDLINWEQVSQKGIPSVKSGQDVVEVTYDIDLSGYKYFHIRNTYIANARMIINSMTG